MNNLKICTLHFLVFRKHWIPLHWRIVGFQWQLIDRSRCHSAFQFCLCNLVLLQGKIQHKSSDATQNGSLSQSWSPYRSFSITQMVEEGSVCVCVCKLRISIILGWLSVVLFWSVVMWVLGFIFAVGLYFCQQIENRFSPQSKQTEIERRSGQRSEQTVDSRALRVCGYR